MNTLEIVSQLNSFHIVSLINIEHNVNSIRLVDLMWFYPSFVFSCVLLITSQVSFSIAALNTALNSKMISDK